MPRQTLRNLTGRERTLRANRQLGLLLAFVAGAITTTLLVNWARQRRMHSEYALSLLLEAVLLLIFGVLGASLALHTTLLVPATVTLLCFIMGLQNALVTKISNAVVRTTHMTGVITDLGIEIGRLLYWNRRSSPAETHFVKADRSRLKLHAALLCCFAGGGLAGALSFQLLSYAATLPIALLLAVLASVPIADDLQQSP